MTAVWAWACPSHRVDMTCIWPGSNRSKEEGSGRMVQLLTEANAALHPPPSSSAAARDSAHFRGSKLPCEPIGPDGRGGCQGGHPCPPSGVCPPLAGEPVRISASPRAPWVALDGGDCCPGTTNCTGGKGPYAMSTGGGLPVNGGSTVRRHSQVPRVWSDALVRHALLLRHHCIVRRGVQGLQSDRLRLQVRRSTGRGAAVPLDRTR